MVAQTRNIECFHWGEAVHCHTAGEAAAASLCPSQGLCCACNLPPLIAGWVDQCIGWVGLASTRTGPGLLSWHPDVPVQAGGLHGAK
jgi:hypothetical protein